MPLTRQQKEQRVAQTQESIAGAVSVVFMTYDGLTVDAMEDLRDKLHAEGAALKVLPKRLLKIVLQQAKLDFDPTTTTGQLAIVWGPDPVMPAKVLHTFAKEHETVHLVAGTLEGKLLGLEDVRALALLPTRHELLGKLVGTLVNPIRGFATVLNGVQRQTVYVLQAIADQKAAV
jgi:large subunit ribosomal protein L10